LSAALLHNLKMNQQLKAMDPEETVRLGAETGLPELASPFCLHPGR
jgi:hypothetical protein